MHIKLASLLFLACYWYSSSSTLYLELSSFIWESLHQCHLPNNAERLKVQTYNEDLAHRISSKSHDEPKLHPKNFNGQFNGHKLHSDRNSILVNIGHENLLIFLKYYMKCVEAYWDSCVNLQTMSIHEGQQKASLSLRPCYHGHLHFLDNIDYVLQIQVHQIFQINLTFTHFNLKRAHPYCDFHSIKVSQGHQQHNHNRVHTI